MSEKRYSLRTVGELMGITLHAVHLRARKAGIDTSRGLTAKEVKMLLEMPVNRKRGRATLDELKAELEVLE